MSVTNNDRMKPVREKCSYSKFFWSVFFRIRTEYGEILRFSLYSVQMPENTDQKTPNTDTFHAVSILSGSKN